LLRSALIGCLASIAGAIVLVVGMRVPSAFIEPGTEGFRGEGREMADAFYSFEMWRKFSEGPEAYMVTGAYVTRVRKCPGAPPYDPQSTLMYGTEISGTIRVHTIFGIPYRKIEAKCSATG
jgi:hypothetical protein